MIRKNAWAITVTMISFLFLSLASGFARDPFEAVAGTYSGSVTLGDPYDGSPIARESLMTIDLGLQLKRTGSQWDLQESTLSLKRFVTTHPPSCSEGFPARELKAALESLTIQPDGTLQATAQPLRLCVNNRVVERKVQLNGKILTRNNCAYVEIRGGSFGDYTETVTNLILLPGTDQIQMKGTLSLLKIKEPTDYQAPLEPDTCTDLNPDL